MQTTTFEIDEKTTFKLTIPKDKFRVGGVDSQYQSVGAWNQMAVTVVNNILKFEHATSLPCVDVYASFGFFSMLSVMCGHKAIVCETNPLCNDCITKSIIDNNVSSSTIEHHSSFVSNETVLDGKRTIALRDLAPQGILLLRVGSCCQREGDVIESARVSGVLSVKYIMFEVMTIHNGKLNRKPVATILQLIKDDGYILHEIGQHDIQRIDNFDRHMAGWLHAHKTGTYTGRSLLLAVHSSSTIDLTAS
jgi:hypothetical protein